MVDIYTSTGTFSWVCPADVYSVVAETWGSGGHGGDGGGTPSGGLTMNGGGGGAYSRGTISVTPGLTYTVVVPAGGSVADARFHLSGTNLVMAKSGTTGTTSSAGLGGAAASGVGDVKFSGGNSGTRGPGAGSTGGGSSAGTAANGNTGNTNSGDTGGAGATAPTGGGNGGTGGNNNGAGSAGAAPGGGGGGGEDSGGTGGNGKVVLTYFKNYTKTVSETLTLSASLITVLGHVKTVSDIVTVTASKIGTSFYKVAEETIIILEHLLKYRVWIASYIDLITVVSSVVTLYQRAWRRLERVVTEWTKEDRTGDGGDWTPTDKQF